MAMYIHVVPLHTIATCVHMHVCMCYSPDEVVLPKDDPMVQELSDVLREWSVVWKRLYAVRHSTCAHTCTQSHSDTHSHEQHGCIVNGE